MSIAANASWIFWLIWLAAGAGYEIFAVVTHPGWGSLPLTDILRDRWMRASKIFTVVMWIFLSWLWAHFLLNLP